MARTKTKAKRYWYDFEISIPASSRAEAIKIARAMRGKRHIAMEYKRKGSAVS